MAVKGADGKITITADTSKANTGIKKLSDNLKKAKTPKTKNILLRSSFILKIWTIF